MGVVTGQVRIRVPWDPNRLNPNRVAGRHWGSVTGLKRSAASAAAFAWVSAGEPRFEGPVDVLLIVRRGRVMDDDNAVAGCKAIQDALFKGRVTPDDAARTVRMLGVQWETGAQWERNPEVVYVVQAREAR